MAGTTIRVTGLEETRRAFRKAEGITPREFPKELRKVAEPVRSMTAVRLASYSSRTASGVKARVRGSTALVQQSQRKTTGDHPNYGGLQMRHGFLPALAASEREIISGVEEMVDRVISRAGLS